MDIPADTSQQGRAVSRRRAGPEYENTHGVQAVTI